MNRDIQELLRLLQMAPARLTVEQVAAVLQCSVRHIIALRHAGLLRPLGEPSSNAVKYYSTNDLRQKIMDDAWLDAVTDAIYEADRK